MELRHIGHVILPMQLLRAMATNTRLLTSVTLDVSVSVIPMLEASVPMYILFTSVPLDVPRLPILLLKTTASNDIRLTSLPLVGVSSLRNGRPAP